VKNNLAFPLKMQKYSRTEIKERVMEAAKLLRIDNILDAKISSLAGGDRQRVALGRALVRRPKAFLMDEPLGTLDSEFRELMCLELRKLHDDIDATTVYVTHDQQEAMSMADRIAVMNEGEILQADAPSVIYNKPKSKFVASFIGSPAMNFIPFNQAVQKNQTEINIEGVKIKIPNQHENSAGQENFLGIRPENLKLVSNGGISGKVFGIEYLGSRKIVTIDTSFGKIKVRIDSNVNLDIEENVQFTPSNNNQIIFDGKTDKSLISDFLS
jgi:multiple sugar transport system ATP-binding protein